MTDRIIFRTIFEAVNKARSDQKMNPFYENQALIPAAQDYAQYFVAYESEEVSPNPLHLESSIKDKYEDVYDHVFARFIFEDELDSTANNRPTLIEVAEEIANLFLETELDREIILNPEYNCVSIGFRHSTVQMGVVLVFTKLKAGITEIAEVRL